MDETIKRVIRYSTKTSQGAMIKLYSLGLLFLLLMLISLHSRASTYVMGRPFYVGASGTGFTEDYGVAARSWVLAVCPPGGIKSSCSASFVKKVFDDSESGWRIHLMINYTVIYQNPPPKDPTIVNGSDLFVMILVYECPPGFSPVGTKSYPGLCMAPENGRAPSPSSIQSKTKCNCDGLGSEPIAAPIVGNPVLPASGVKQLIETDYANASGTLRVDRIYRGDTNRWEFGYQKNAASLSSISPYATKGIGCYMAKGDLGDAYCYPYAALGTTNDIAVRRAGGRVIYFSSSNSSLPASDINDRITPRFENGYPAGWTVINGDDDSIENYDATDVLVDSTSRNGQKTTYTYSNISTPESIAPTQGLLLSIRDAFGSELKFTYDFRANLNTITDPAGQVYQYIFDANNNLLSVTYPDGKTKKYLYGEKSNIETGFALPLALTGVIDENDSRFSNYKYSGNSSVTSTELAGGVNRYTFTYPNRYRQTYITDPLGTVRSYLFSNYGGITKNISITQPSPTGSGWVSKTMVYDANGNISSSIDFNGNKTTFTYDMARNLELTRVDAAGTVNARTTTTAWHPTWRLPLKIAEPKRITTFIYDGNGNVLTRSIQASSDGTGAAGLSAALVGTARVWTYTYDSLGHLLTAKGPRTDVKDLTSYVYDEQGNLTSVTNALGHVTTFSNYDPHGHVGRVTDPNGLNTDYTYTPRGWLATRTVGSEITSYTYDGVGQMTQVTLPDNSTISYTYDSAHRLTNIADSLGNKITYTLDAKGNRTAETVNDLNGILARKTTRVYDVLNNLKQQIGGEQ